MTTDQWPSMRLRVARARPQDVGRGIARLSPAALRQLHLEEGDVLEILGKRRTVAVALRLPFQDRGLDDLLRLDGLQRQNAGVSIGDYARAGRATVVPAQHLVLAWAQGTPRPAGWAEALRRSLLNRPLVENDVIATDALRLGTDGDSGPAPAQQPALAFHQVRLRVVSTAPTGVVRVVDSTGIELTTAPDGLREGRHRSGITYDDVGGLGDAVRQVRELIELPLTHSELIERFGVDPPKGILLHGPPGTGKTLLARAVANEADAAFFYVGGPEIMLPYQGESEQRLREIFEEARRHAPAVIFLDDIDAIAPKRALASGGAERRVVAQLLTLMDGLEPRRNVVVIGATNFVDALDEGLRRPGRFDREVAVGVPDQAGRLEVLTIHTRGMPLAPDVDLRELAQTTYGFVGADLAALAREAAMHALHRCIAALERDGAALESDEQRLEVTRDDFESARRRVQPSAMREVAIELPSVRWKDVGGLEQPKRTLRDSIELPLKYPEALQRLGIRAAKGLLLFGPPGTGKTLLAKAVAREAEANFIGVRSSDLLSKWYGESEQQISRLFRRARQVAPAIVFIDELDSLAPHRGAAPGEPVVTDRVVNTLLAEMDGLEELHHVFVIGATNRPLLVDPALLRPGRFDELVYVSPPDREGRLHILRVHTAAMPLAADVNLAWLADRTQGYTGADLEGLVRRAGFHAFRDDPEATEVSMDCFRQALAESHASVTPELEREYEMLLEELKRESPRGSRRIGFLVEEEPSPHGPA